MKRLFTYVLLLTVIWGCSSTSERILIWKANTVSLASWDEDVMYILSGQRDFVAKAWDIEVPEEEVWSLVGPDDQTHPMLVSVISDVAFLKDKPESYLYTRTNKGEKCSKNVPLVIGKCIRRAGNINLYMKKNESGYAACETAQPNDVCKEFVSKIGVWEYYGRGNSNCSGPPVLIVGNKKPERWVCVPQ
ncbi:MAG: hypothetical protein V3W18_14300 [candidate division Zixibacteria bacterium]